MWRDAIGKEMFNVRVAFEILGDKEKAPIGWVKVTGHMIFDVKMSFELKARWVLDGHKTPNIEGSTYAGVCSRESVQIIMTYAALNKLPLMAADIRNAYLQAPSSQKNYIICGPEFGLENVGRTALIHRALYGGKSAGRDFRNHLCSCMHFLNFKSCPADPDVWMRPSIKSDGSEC
jgi:Reverse transcriptase (RNA-dependent DNA polymerase)